METSETLLALAAALGISVVVVVATYLTVVWLRSRRKRLGLRPRAIEGTWLPKVERPPFTLPDGIEEEAALDYRLGYVAGWNAALKPSSPPTPGPSRRPQP